MAASQKADTKHEPPNPGYAETARIGSGDRRFLESHLIDQHGRCGITEIDAARPCPYIGVRRSTSMSETAEKVRADALGLPAEERAELAYCLIRSLDEKDDPDVESAREAELERRWQDMESGKVAGQLADRVFGGARESSP
jgi:putative addiction module component (TIGR02574 family)